MTIKSIHGTTILFILFLISGCATVEPPTGGPDPSNPVASIAILPMQNLTSDMKAPNWIRLAFTDAVRSRYYEVMPSDES